MAQLPYPAVPFIQPRNDDTSQRLEWKTASILYAGMGLAGVDGVTSAVPAAGGNWWAFHAITDCVIAAITYRPGTQGGANVWAGQTVKAGDRIYGNITAVSLVSGSGEVYRAAITV